MELTKKDKKKIYNDLCDLMHHEPKKFNISAESRAKSLHKELGYAEEGYSLCFMEEGI